MTITTYVAKCGDWLAKIAEEHSSTVSEIWSHPENAEHRAKRGSPDVLYPGDVLRIPVADPPAVEPPLLHKPAPGPNGPPAPGLPWAYPPYEGPFTTKPTWECPGGTCQCHPVPKDEPKDEHVIVFYDPQGKRMPGARCRVYEQGRLLTPDPTTSDGAGELRVEINASTSTLRVEWAPANMPPHQFLPYHKTYNVKMGGDADVGLDRRLANLGFSRGKRREDNVRDYQRAYTRPETGDAEEIRLEVLDRHDNGAVEVFHPQEPAGTPVGSSPQTRALLGSPATSPTPRKQLVPNGQSAGGGNGAGQTTSTGQNVQGAAVPDASNMVLYVAVEPDFPELDPTAVKLTVMPVDVPGMTAEQRATPVQPTIGATPGAVKPAHLLYYFQDLPLGTYDVFAYMEKVARSSGKGTTWALGYTRVKLQMGLGTLAYAKVLRQRPVLTVDDPALDFDIPPMQRRRKVLAAIHDMLPMSKAPTATLAAIAGIHPPYGQRPFKKMLLGAPGENTCTAVNGAIMDRACGVGRAAGIKGKTYFVEWQDGLCPSVGDSIVYEGHGEFHHIGIIVESSPDSGAIWIAADGGQPDRTTEFRKAAGTATNWGRFWRDPDPVTSYESAWLLPRHYVISNGEAIVIHGWAAPLVEDGGGLPILGWADITHPDYTFPQLDYKKGASKADYEACKVEVRKVRSGTPADIDACRAIKRSGTPKASP